MDIQQYNIKAKRKNFDKFPKEDQWVIGVLSQVVIPIPGPVQESPFEKTPVLIKGLEGNRANLIPIVEDTICRPTGKKDKNGKLIWENDIVKGYHGDKEFFGVVKYDNEAAAFLIYEGIFGNTFTNEGPISVEGNIFDNEELLYQ